MLFRSAKQQKIPLKKLTKEFFEAVVNEGINGNDLYEWILKSNTFNLVPSQREELATGERVLKLSDIEK